MNDKGQPCKPKEAYMLTWSGAETWYRVKPESGLPDRKPQDGDSPCGAAKSGADSPSPPTEADG